MIMDTMKRDALLALREKIVRALYYDFPRNAGIGYASGPI